MTTRKIQSWVTPPEDDEEFAACMEQVLEIYHQPPDPEFPVVAMDEQPIQLLAETHEIIPATPARDGHAGHPERIDYKYERRGTASVFMFIAPFLNWRRVTVRRRRTKRDWAEEIEWLVMHDFRDAKKITILSDNLNTHTKGALYKRYPAEYAMEILRRIEFIHTPIHGSWLNIAESELSVLTSQCLCRRLANISEVRRQVSAWTSWRNDHASGVNWQFTTDDARIKLASIYPKFQFDNE
jgi:hypothetical protein